MTEKTFPKVDQKTLDELDALMTAARDAMASYQKALAAARAAAGVPAGIALGKDGTWLVPGNFYGG